MDILDALLLEGKSPTIVSLRDKVSIAAKMLLHLLEPDYRINVSQLARRWGVSRQSLYTWGWLAIAALGTACLAECPGPKPTEREPSLITALKEQIAQLQWDRDRLRFENRQLQAEVAALTMDLLQLVQRAIIILRLSGKVSYRGIQECLHYLVGVHVPLAEIEAQVMAAGERARTVLPDLLAQVRAIWVAIDEIYLREAGRQIYGLLVVDLSTRVAIALQRATDRQATTWQQVMGPLPQLRETLRGLVSDLARPYPRLVRMLSALWKRNLILQECNVHAMRQLFKLTDKALGPYRKAKRRYKAARKVLTQQPEDVTAQSEYWAARQMRRFHWRMSKYALTLSRQVMAALRQPTGRAAKAALDQTLAQLAQLSADYQPFARSVIKFISRHRDRLLVHHDYPGLAWTTNMAEGAFSLLRRFVAVYKGFSTQAGVEAFFALFLLYYNLRLQRYEDGQTAAPLARAGIELEGNYLNYLGYETPTRMVQYATLQQRAEKVSSEFTTLARAA